MFASRKASLFFLIILVAVLSYTAGYSTLLQFKQHTQQPIAATPAVKHTMLKVNSEYVRCMATNIYWEAGGEPFMGQVMVARVVMNRIKHGFAKNPCSVVYSETTVLHDDQERRLCQFSWVCEGKETPQRNAVYKQAEEIAKKVLIENAWSDIVPHNVLFFHNKTVSPSWKHTPVITVGNHVFYAKNVNYKQ